MKYEWAVVSAFLVAGCGSENLNLQCGLNGIQQPVNACLTFEPDLGGTCPAGYELVEVDEEAVGCPVDL